MRILILCTGNSCRSQMAHGFLQAMDSSLEVFSGGTQPAARVNARAVEVMREAGIDIASHIPTHVNVYLDQEWDYVITVCGGANESCPAFTGKVGRRLHMGFDDPSHAEGSPEFIDSEFRRVRDEIRAAFARFYRSEIQKRNFMNTLLETLRYFVLIAVELIALFLLISALVEIILMYVPEEKIRKKLSGAGIFGNIIAAGFGALTPFCACSTIPMTVGFLNAGVPFGSAISFLIASPLLNPIILGMLGAMVGIKAMAAYFVIAFSCSVLFGLLLERLGAQRYVKNVRLKPATCCAGGEVVDKRSLPFRGKVKAAFAGAWGSLRPIMGYLLIGVALGAGIYGYMPQDFVMKIAGPDNPFAIPVAAVLGIPLYIRAETAIPIGLALMGKGMSIGAVIALIIGGAGMAIAEMTMLASIFKNRLVAMIVLVIFLTAVVSGYLFNILL